MRTILSAVLTCGLMACGSRATVDAGNPAPTSSDRTPNPMPVVAIVDGQRIGYDALQPLLLEAVGGDVLREVVLDRRLRRKLADANLAVSEPDLDAEKTILLLRLSSDADQAARLLERLREARGLGPNRFELMLTRNAMLRKLVAGRVEINEALIRQAYEQRYGPQTVCRLILVDTLVEAERVLARLRAGEDFAAIAGLVSKDASRTQGGLIPAIAPDDPTYPSAVRDVAGRLDVGMVSDPIALEGGIALLKCDQKIAARSVEIESVRGELEKIVRLRIETLLMQQLARAELDAADVTALDAQLDQSYQRAVKSGIGAE